MVRCLRQTDAQLFSGYLDVPCVFDKEILDVIRSLSFVLTDSLKQESKNE
jgi:hypothetical protein